MNLTAEIAVAPFTVGRDSSGMLRAVADTCLERLVRELTALGITVARYPELSEKKLQVARPVPLAVLGHVDQKEGPGPGGAASARSRLGGRATVLL